MQTAFAIPTSLKPSSPYSNQLPLRQSKSPNRVVARRPRISASLSSPFPLPDLFAFPNVVFLSSTASSDFRPELLGSLLWSAGLYLGFSQRKRWASFVYDSQISLLKSLKLPHIAAEIITLPTHSLPFIATGFAIDALMRHANGGNPVWAIAAGLSVAMYGGIYELGRISAGGKKLSEEDTMRYALFDDFAQRRLQARGMCHLVDIRAAVRSDPKARRLSNLSDESLRRFVRNRFPRAKRSPNGYYRGLSLSEVSQVRSQSPSTGEFNER